MVSSLSGSTHAPPRPCAPVAFRGKSRNQQAWNSFLTWPHLRCLIITWADNSIPQSIASLLLPNSVSRRSSLDSRRLLPTPPPPSTPNCVAATSYIIRPRRKTINDANRNYSNGHKGVSDLVPSLRLHLAKPSMRHTHVLAWVLGKLGGWRWGGGGRPDVVSGCVTSLTNGWWEMVTGLCEGGGEENPWRDMFGSFFRLLQQRGVREGRWRWGHRGSS